jgi:hypothetical protein
MTNSLNKVIFCYSLFGDNETGVIDKKYLKGLEKISRSCMENGYHYALVNRLFIEKYVKRKIEVSGFFYRFLVYDCYKEYDTFLFRDLDSELSERDIASVREWIESGKTLLIQRDHPHHDWAMMGGMWGIKRVEGLNMTDLILDWVEKNPYPEYFGRKDKPDGWMTDMFFLRDVIFPMFKDDCLQHDELFGDKYGETRPFPTKRKGLEYVGETVEADGSVSEPHRQILKQYLDEKRNKLY